MKLFNSALYILCAMLLSSCSPQATLEVPKEFQKGQKYFHKVCSNCHGADARGKQTQAPNLIDTDFLTDIFSDDDLRATIIDGTDKMPSQRRKVTDDEINQIIKYLRHSQKAADLYIATEEDIEEEEAEDEEEAELEEVSPLITG